MKIRDHIQVLPQPTVVRLEHLQDEDSDWITAGYYLTDAVRNCLESIRLLLSKPTGSGIFLIGHYGSGKSHFLAYVTRQVQRGVLASDKIKAAPVSLLRFKASQPLESIVAESMGVGAGEADREKTWNEVHTRNAGGLFLILDELSEFLRSKPTPQSFNEDLRFLQFLGEWAQDHPLWILAALQEQIEHTGDIEYDLFRKIKDRYPIRYLLTPAHVKDLIAHRILIKKPSYGRAAQELVQELRGIYADDSIDYAGLQEIYPLHPATLELLEEIRDRFSQARGIVDFALTRLLGDEVRGIRAFLDEPWGTLLTPDVIVDHFADLFEVQPEFLPIAQKVFPYFRENIPKLFEKKSQQELAWRILKCMILVELSPRREYLKPEEAAQWLLLRLSTIEPTRNREIVRRILETFSGRGHFVRRKNDGYRLDLEDTSAADLEHLIARTLDEIRTRGDAVYEDLVPLLEPSDFNPFTLPRDRWHVRKVRWHFHERDVHCYIGGGNPGETTAPAVQIGLPWGPAAQGAACLRIVPSPITSTPEIQELAVLQILRERALPSALQSRVQERIAARKPAFAAMIRAAYAEARAFDGLGQELHPPLNPIHAGTGRWLNVYGEWALRQTFPMFERFAPGFGPLPREARRLFMKYAGENDLGIEDAPDYVKLIREAYLVPMGLMRRRGSEYLFEIKLDHHELMRHLAPILEHHPAPSRVYEHLGSPVYGLVPDQIHLLLAVLVIHGEIDIVKGKHSYRDYFETLVDPLQYDRIVPGQALNLARLRDLNTLCEAFRIRLPKQWTVLAQKRAIGSLTQLGRKHRDQLSGFLGRVRAAGGAGDLEGRIEQLILQWAALEKGEHELQSFQHFLYSIGSPERFASEASELISLPDRYEKLLHDAQRFRHLLSYPSVAEGASPDIASEVDSLNLLSPSIDQPESLESWLQRARSLYEKYQAWYRLEHERFWQHAQHHRLWSWTPPGIARSRHLALSDTVDRIEKLRAQARAGRCTGITSLEFQPFCRCGFGAGTSPLSEILRQFEERTLSLERELELFFQPDRVRARVRQWVDQGLEMQTRTLAYLEGKAPYPEVANVTLFDQHLAGLELVQSVRAEDLLEFLGERTWEKGALRKALDDFFRRLGTHIALRREPIAPRQDLVAWCCEQALRSGSALPPGLNPAELQLAARLIEPPWISEQSLVRLEQLNLPEDALSRVLELVLDGLVRQPRAEISRGPVAAALRLQRREIPETPAELATLAALLYEQNERLRGVRAKPWLSYLDEVAGAKLRETPEALPSLLAGRAAAQWIIIDCLGIALLPTLEGLLPAALPHWKARDVIFALCGRRTTTDAFYGSLLERGIQKDFRKINAVDALMHKRRISFGDFLCLARAELEISLKGLLASLDPDRPLLLFGDHGFRLSPDGASLSHGGSSTLERLVPVLDLHPHLPGAARLPGKVE